MRPPICAICKKRFDPRGEGGKVYFKLTEKQKENNKKMKEPGMVGHPGGLEWFCEIHYEMAKSYNHLHSHDAIDTIKKQLKKGSWKSDNEIITETSKSEEE